MEEGGIVNRQRVVGILVSAAIAACSGTPSSSDGSARPGLPSADSTVASSSPAPAPSATPSMPAAVAGSKIVFTRNDDVWLHTTYMIDPDGTNEHVLPVGGLQPGAWSSDHRHLAIGVLVDAQSRLSNADSAWMRPAVINEDGTGFKVVDGVPGRKMNLVPVGWSGDGSRIYAFSGFDAPDLADIGLFSVRASDGGDLRVVLRTDPADIRSGRAGESCARPDAVQLSPDGSKLLVSRQTPKDVCGTVLVFNADGSDEVRLNPEGTIGVDLDIRDYLERGRISESFSHDGARVAFGGFVVSADSTALFVGGADGRDVRQIASPDVGATSATWSPDDTWIAFTSRLRSSPQVWRVHPDGSGLQQLTDGADGSSSVMPVWSPDGSKLLFERKQAGQVTLWTMNADGTEASQLSPTPIGSEYFGPYEWWPAPAN
jgi:dipeptidyl aminopeptidase/acylaminoacyl peptidase